MKSSTVSTLKRIIKEEVAKQLRSRHRLTEAAKFDVGETVYPADAEEDETYDILIVFSDGVKGMQYVEKNLGVGDVAPDALDQYGYNIKQNPKMKMEPSYLLDDGRLYAESELELA